MSATSVNDSVPSSSSRSGVPTPISMRPTSATTHQTATTLMNKQQKQEESECRHGPTQKPTCASAPPSSTSASAAAHAVVSAPAYPNSHPYSFRNSKFGGIVKHSANGSTTTVNSANNNNFNAAVVSTPVYSDSTLIYTPTAYGGGCGGGSGDNSSRPSSSASPVNRLHPRGFINGLSSSFRRNSADLYSRNANASSNSASNPANSLSSLAASSTGSAPEDLIRSELEGWHQRIMSALRIVGLGKVEALTHRATQHTNTSGGGGLVGGVSSSSSPSIYTTGLSSTTAVISPNKHGKSSSERRAELRKLQDQYDHLNRMLGIARSALLQQKRNHDIGFLIRRMNNSGIVTHSTASASLSRPPTPSSYTSTSASSPNKSSSAPSPTANSTQSFSELRRLEEERAAGEESVREALFRLQLDGPVLCDTTGIVFNDPSLSAFILPPPTGEVIVDREEAAAEAAKREREERERQEQIAAKEREAVNEEAHRPRQLTAQAEEAPAKNAEDEGNASNNVYSEEIDQLLTHILSLQLQIADKKAEEDRKAREALEAVTAEKDMLAEENKRLLDVISALQAQMAQKEE